MPNEDHAIEQNELLFLEHHRSAVQDLGFGKLFVSSDRTVKTWNFIGAITGDVDLALCEEIFADWKMTPCFKVTPWTPPAVETQLQAAGWSPAVTLTHMVHATGEIAAPPDVAVRRCETPDDIRIFSDVQSVAFGAPAWISWVLKVNLVNLPRPNQRFYLAELDGKTVGVLLLVLDGAVGGLYAVATLPDTCAGSARHS